MAFWKRNRLSDVWADALQPAPPARAAWLRGRMLEPDLTRGVRVGDVVPTGFEAYVRVMHPVPTPDGPSTWREVAEQTGRLAHARMQWQAVAFPAPGHQAPTVIGDGPSQGALPSDLMANLIDIVAIHTSAAETAYFAVWVDTPGLPETGTGEVTFGGRTYHLFTADLSTAAKPLVVDSNGVAVDPPVSPHLWWPEDRAWVVATDVDFRSTFVAAPRSCGEQILSDSAFESYEVAVDDRADLGGDDRNPLPPSLAHLFS